VDPGAGCRHDRGMVRTFLLDGTALAYRSHFALAAGREGGLTTTSGHPTSATFGFLMTLRAILKREQVDRIAVAFDGPSAKLERTKLYPEYKATREKAPDELRMQFDDVREVVQGYGIPIIEVEGHEADDVIGTLAVRCRDAGDEVYIVTGDKDFMQLVDSDKLRLYDIMRRGSAEPKIYGPDEVVEKFGVPPERIVDLLALMGDASDNVPGVPGVGPKTAAQLLEAHGTLDEVLRTADANRKPKLRRNLIDFREQALLSRDLVRIRLDLDLPIAPDDLHAIQPDEPRLLEIFKRLEFRRFVDELMGGASEGTASEVGQSIDYRIVESLEECRALVRRLEHVERFSLCTLATRTTTGEAELVGLAFSQRAHKGWYLPLRGPVLPTGHDRETWLACFKALLEEPRHEKLGHDAKETTKLLRCHGIELRGVAFDPMLASYCIAPGQRAHDLSHLAQHHLDVHYSPQSELTGTGKKAIQLSMVPVTDLGFWAAQGCDLALRLREPLLAEVELFGVGEILCDIEMPLLPVLVAVEERGVRLDTDYMTELGAELHKRIDELNRSIWRDTGREFNIASNQQLGQVLFEEIELHKKLGVRAPKRTRTGQWATDHTTLERMTPHPLVDAVIEHRRLSKLIGTYVEALPQLVRPSTGRVHTTFNQAVAATGRLSSEDPNLQNIPIRTEDGRRLRRAFVAGNPGWVLVSADYSQIELRILAHMSGDANLQAGFREGEDVHARTASIVFGVLPTMVNTELRSQAKVINYGLVYGMGVTRVAQETGMSQADAKKFVDAYFRAMPKVKQWLDDTLDGARETGEVRTLYGRRRPVPEVFSKAPGIRAAAQNVAVNSPIQGTAADIIKRAMIRLDETIAERGLEGRMLLQVHDELVIECPEGEATQMSAVVKEAMEGAADLDVPLDVDIGVGPTWLDAHS
jgi:DNA polymerase-1